MQKPRLLLYQPNICTRTVAQTCFSEILYKEFSPAPELQLGPWVHGPWTYANRPPSCCMVGFLVAFAFKLSLSFILVECYRELNCGPQKIYPPESQNVILFRKIVFADIQVHISRHIRVRPKSGNECLYVEKEKTHTLRQVL